MRQFTNTASITTQSGERYLQQLCKHWSHNLEVELTAGRGSVVFPKDLRGAEFPSDAIVTFTSTDHSLEVRIDASSSGQLENLQGVVARHLDRFAFREAPLNFNWK